MALTDTDVKAKYTANGSNDTFAIPFDYVSSDQVDVYTADESVDPVTETLKTITTDYTIVGSNVVFNSAPVSGLKVIIIRASSFVQDTDYTSNSSFPAETHEDALDYLTYLCQELKEMLSRAPISRLSTAVRSSPWTLPDPEAGAVIGWNSDADDLENIEITDGNLRADAVDLTNGSTSKAVSFSSSYANTSYSVICTIENTTDISPMFQPVVITSKSVSGFTASWNAPLDSANYKLNYLVLPDA